MKDFIELSGIFEQKVYRIINNKRILIRDYKDNNLVVTLGKEKVIKLLANDGVGNYISQISFGESSSSPALDDTTITNAFSKALASYSYPTSSSVKFEWVLELTEANGKDIYEYGLLSNDSVLFARKISGLIEKESDIIIEGSWTIIII